MPFEMAASAEQSNEENCTGEEEHKSDTGCRTSRVISSWSAVVVVVVVLSNSNHHFESESGAKLDRSGSQRPVCSCFFALAVSSSFAVSSSIGVSNLLPLSWLSSLPAAAAVRTADRYFSLL